MSSQTSFPYIDDDDEEDDEKSLVPSSPIASPAIVPTIPNITADFDCLPISSSTPFKTAKNGSYPKADLSVSAVTINDISQMTTSEELETLDEKKFRLQSHKIIYVTCFIMSMGFSLVITSVWPFLKQVIYFLTFIY